MSFEIAPQQPSATDAVVSGDGRARSGRDVLFVDNDIPLDARGDFKTVDGEAALRQAILIMLITSPGEYKLRPNFGIGALQFVKKAASKTIRDELRRRIFDGLSRDSRIEKVLDVVIERQATPALVRVSITARAFGRVINFVPYQLREAA